MTSIEDLELKFVLSSTGEMHAEHLGSDAVHPSVLGVWTGRLG